MLSHLCLEFFQVVAATLHLVLPANLEPAVSTFLIGSLFGLSLIPLATLYVALRPTKVPLTLVLLTLLVYWVTLDDSHKRPRGGPREPRTCVEKAAAAFWASSFAYFPMTLTTEGSHEGRYVFAVHPHGIHCWPLNVFGFRLFGSMTGLSASIMFRLPVLREMFLWMGYCDASRHVAARALEQGSIYVCTGGEQESLATVVGRDRVVLKSRKGFVRLALAAGVDLVPVFGFGVSDLYTTYSAFASLRSFIQKKFSLAFPIFHGAYLTPMPYKVPINVVVGAPVALPKRPPEHDAAEWPSPAVIDEAHAAYVDALIALHKRHAPPGRQLEII